MNKIKLAMIAGFFVASFSSMATGTDPLGNFINALPNQTQSTLPLQKATVIQVPGPKSPEYIRALYKLSDKQETVLRYAYRVGNKYDAKTAKLSDDEKAKKLGYHLAAIAWIESRACENTGKGKKGHGAYGCWQVTTASATPRLATKHTKKEVVKKLETLQGGSYYAVAELEYWLGYHKGNMKKALASYNAGFKYNSRQAREYASMVTRTAKLLEENSII